MESIVAIVKRHLHRKKKDGTDGFLQLFISKRLIQGAAAAILGIFVPIFLYETTGEEFYIVGVYYALISLLYVFLLVPAMKVTNKIGFSHVLVMGMGFNVILYTIMFFLTPENVWYMIFPLALALLGFRLFHWVPFHVDFTLFTKNGERGRQVSLSFAVIAFMGVIGPILAGFIITHAGYNALFGTAV